MVRFALAFVLSTMVTYAILASLVALYCLLGGHNLLEALYSSFAAIVLSLAAGVELACRAAPARKAMRG